MTRTIIIAIGDFISKAFLFIWKMILRWNQFWVVPLGLILIYYTPWIMRVSGYGPTAGEFDPVFLLKPIYAIFYVSILSGFAWLFFKITFPTLYKYVEDFMITDFKTLEPWQKISISLFVVFFYLWAFMQALNAI